MFGPQLSNTKERVHVDPEHVHVYQDDRAEDTMPVVWEKKIRNEKHSERGNKKTKKTKIKIKPPVMNEV